MTVEIHDKLIALLAGVDVLKIKEAQLKSEKTRHLDQIAQSEGDVQKCNDEPDDHS
jgi:hypothetical protein